MNPSTSCPLCGAALAPNTPQGLCPACLLKAGMPSAPAATHAARAKPFVPPTPEQLAPSFPQLEIIELIGQGGMGAVYRARQPNLDRIVALKILPAQTGRAPGFAERFQREARALAKLNHPNIVAVHDFGESGGYPYFVMEFVDGLTLRHLLASGKMEARAALAIVPTICEALQYAHDRGIVHRDIKPENILMDKRGVLKIADFGLAKLMDAPTPDLAMTGARDVMGTPHYMAPEQVERPRSVDHRADIYSLGVVFYQMLTGELPLGRFAAPSRRVAVDVRLDEVVLRALEKEPELRYPQVSALKTEVDRIAASPGAPATAEDDSEAARIARAPATTMALMHGLNLAGTAGAIGIAINDFSLDTLGWGKIYPLLPLTTLQYAWIAGYVFALVGALRMRKMKDYKSSLMAAALSTVMPLLPTLFLPLWLHRNAWFFLMVLGPCVGIWAFITLLRADVRGRFAARTGEARLVEKAWWTPVVGVASAAVAVYSVPAFVGMTEVLAAPLTIPAQPTPTAAKHLPANTNSPQRTSAVTSAAVPVPTGQSPAAIAPVASAYPPTDFDRMESNPAILRELIEQAHSDSKQAKARVASGLMDLSEADRLDFMAQRLEARLRGDRVAAAEIDLRETERALPPLRNRYAAGLEVGRTVEAAQRNVRIARIRLHEELRRREAAAAASASAPSPSQP